MPRDFCSHSFVLLLVSSVACSEPETPTGPVAPAETVPVNPEIVQWLGENVVAFDTAGWREDRSDLAALSEIVGDARVVALGEATHGTREFFQMKHRVLNYLVHEKGFTAFGIEATWPEVNRINDYVHTGEGDPAVLLAGQYFWTWSTQSVLDMIEWMRSYNASRGASEALSFLGFDMQFPGMAIYNVGRFLQPIDSADADSLAVLYECMDANDARGRFARRYSDRTASYQNACRQQIDEAHAFLISNRDRLEAASSTGAFARALRSARLVQQYEDMVVQRVPFARDQYMAENAIWLLEQEGPDAKIVLWAHNLHVSTRTGWMGMHLREVFGDDLVIVGFDFFAGSFTAVTQTGTGEFSGLGTHTVLAPSVDTYEHHFSGADRSSSTGRAAWSEAQDAIDVASRRSDFFGRFIQP